MSKRGIEGLFTGMADRQLQKRIKNRISRQTELSLPANGTIGRQIPARQILVNNIDNSNDFVGADDLDNDNDLVGAEEDDMMLDEVYEEGQEVENEQKMPDNNDMDIDEQDENDPAAREEENDNQDQDSEQDTNDSQLLGDDGNNDGEEDDDETHSQQDVDDEIPNEFTYQEYRMITESLMFGQGFNFKKYLRMLQHLGEYKPNVIDAPLLPGASPFTTSQAAIRINGFTKKCNMSALHQQGLLKMMNQLFPTAALPYIKTAKGNIISTVDKYVGEDTRRLLTFDCCPCGKTVYTLDNADLDRCPQPDCNKFRYTACRQCTYAGLTNFGLCFHKTSNRVAKKYYIIVHLYR